MKTSIDLLREICVDRNLPGIHNLLVIYDMFRKRYFSPIIFPIEITSVDSEIDIGQSYCIKYSSAFNAV